MYQFESEQQDVLRAVLMAAKEHLGADISFVAELKGDVQVTRHAESNGNSCPMETGDETAFQDTYCYRLVNGDVPNVINDVRQHPVVESLAVTERLNIKSYIGVPIVLPCGSLFGTLCCVSHTLSNLGDSDVQFLSVLADVLSARIGILNAADESYLVKRRRIQRVLENDPPKMVFQPIVDLSQGSYLGLEALARFQAEPVRGPDKWFSEAWEVGLGIELEVLTMQAALEVLSHLPNNLYVSVNLSAKTLMSPVFMAAARAVDLSRVVFELTEHTIVSDYDCLCTILFQLRRMGARLAVDDVGAGYSGLSHILRLKPQILKLDRQLVADVHFDLAKQSLIAALTTFASHTGTAIVAEGIEVQEEVRALRHLGITSGQGYYFAKPSALTSLFAVKESASTHPISVSSETTKAKLG